MGKLGHFASVLDVCHQGGSTVLYGVLTIQVALWKTPSGTPRYSQGNRVAEILPIVKEHLVQSQEAQQRIYNRGA